MTNLYFSINTTADFSLLRIAGQCLCSKKDLTQSRVKHLVCLQDTNYSRSVEAWKIYFNVHQPPLDQFSLIGLIEEVNA